ncbi:Alpha/beta hydrolase family protein [Clavibacter michiganensis]|uniref:Alpha/beta hydrolase family protein n=2 Tax=Clavibacter michiganensis TaxID=28447 RepID=A0A251Y8Q7_9MICO|nr:Alpha/beta hydrolase family protein [Clavibacter michiganensis]
MRVRPFEARVRGLTLRGSQHLAEGEGPRPTAVLLHGFGGSRVETTGVFVALARRLAAAGIGVVAYDRAGHGESDGEFLDTTVTGDVDDAREVLAAVRALPEVDAGDVHLVGMSLGAVVASVVAAEEGPGIRSLAMWSTAAVFVDDIRAGTIQGRSLASLDADGWFDFAGMRMGPAMRDDALGFDPYARAAGYRGPALLLHGTDDFVPVDYARRYLEPDALGDRAELVVVDGADHGWAQLPQRDEVIARTVAFVRTHAAGRTA